jgi:hypothetical protein
VELVAIGGCEPVIVAAEDGESNGRNARKF